MDMGVPRYMVGGSLQAVLAQRLVRVICESCTQPYQAPAPERAWLRAELGDRAASGAAVPRSRLLALQRHRLPRPHRRVRTAGDDARRDDAANDPDPAHFLKVATPRCAARPCAARRAPGGAGPHHGVRGHAHQ
jgi:MSHA biogenesis protein MshE